MLDGKHEEVEFNLKASLDEFAKKCFFNRCPELKLKFKDPKHALFADGIKEVSNEQIPVSYLVKTRL